MKFKFISTIEPDIIRTKSFEVQIGERKFGSDGIKYWETNLGTMERILFPDEDFRTPVHKLVISIILEHINSIKGIVND